MASPTEVPPGLASPRLSDLLAPLPVDEFLSRYFGVAPFLAAGVADRFPADATVGDGFTAGLARALELELEAPVAAEVGECAGEQPVRQADTDLMLVQLRGRVRYRLQREQQDPEQEFALQPGGMLYIPRGWWLASSCRDADPLGLRFAVVNPTGAQLLAWITERIQQHEAFQRDIPRFAGPGEQQAYQAAMRRVIMRTFRMPDLMLRYSNRLRQQARSSFSGDAQPARLYADGIISFTHDRRPRVARADPQTIHITVAGRPIAFPHEAAPLLNYLIDEAPVPVQKFYSFFAEDFDRDELTSFLSALASEGAIAVE